MLVKIFICFQNFSVCAQTFPAQVERRTIMVWYYRVGEQKHGPVSKAALQALVKSRTIDARTLVRSVEMDSWFPLIDLVSGKVSPSSQQLPRQDPSTPDLAMAAQQDDQFGNLEMETILDAAASTGDDEAGAVTQMDRFTDTNAAPADGSANTAICSQCGRFFPQDQVIAYDDKIICAACKPMFVQKLKEGAVSGTARRYGGFWIRFVAKLIDGLILAIAQWAIMTPVSIMIVPTIVQRSGNQPDPTGFFVLMGISVLIGLLIPIIYTTFFLGRWGATLGKMACGLKVVTPEGEKITYMRAFGRFFAEWISMITIYIGYIIAGFDDEKRALHDRICSTRVVKKR